MSERCCSITALVIALMGCANDPVSSGFVSGYPPETTLSSLSESQAIALCEDASDWLYDSTDLVRLAVISQSLNGSTDAADCETRLPGYEAVTADQSAARLIFSEDCASAGVRLSTCPQSIESFEALFEWLRTDVDYQNSRLSCDLADMPDVWREIHRTDRTPAHLQPLWQCMVGR